MTRTEKIGQELDKVGTKQNAGAAHKCKNRVHLGVDYAEPNYLLSLGVTGTIPKGDIQAIKAKSKNGKSFLCSIFIASLFGCKDFGFEVCREVGKVLYFDTEQNPRNTAKLVRRIHELIGWDLSEDNSLFAAYALRGEETADRVKIIEEEISFEKPSAIFIDGISDLIENFNDVEQSTKLINELMRISVKYDCSVTCVLHTNKAKEDSGMKGHLGTMLLQKASDVFEVKKDGATFTVEETDCRNEPIEDFAFAIDGHGIPYKAQTAAGRKEQEKADRMTGILNEAFGAGESLTYTDLVESWKKCAAVSVASAKRAVKDSKEMGLIKVDTNGMYSMVK